MRVFVTGATGFIGSAVVQELIRAGHRVLGLARSDAAAQALTAAGAEVHRGSLDDLDSLKRGTTEADGVIHLAFIHDFSRIGDSGKVDRLAIETIGAALARSDRPFVVTSGITAFTPGRAATEKDAPDADSIGRHRVPSELLTTSLATQGVRVSVIRLPPSVHGDGDYGFVPGLIRIARKKSASAYIGEGLNRWAAVHRLDAAILFRLALEKGSAGSTYHGVAEEGVPTRSLAEVIGQRLHHPVISLSSEDAAPHFGWLGYFFAHDCPASSTQTQAELGWLPKHPGLIADLDRPHYFEI